MAPRWCGGDHEHGYGLRRTTDLCERGQASAGAGVRIHHDHTIRARVQRPRQGDHIRRQIVLEPYPIEQLIPPRAVAEQGHHDQRLAACDRGLRRLANRGEFLRGEFHTAGPLVDLFLDAQHLVGQEQREATLAQSPDVDAALHDVVARGWRSFAFDRAFLEDEVGRGSRRLLDRIVERTHQLVDELPHRIEVVALEGLGRDALLDVGVLAHHQQARGRDRGRQVKDEPSGRVAITSFDMSKIAGPWRIPIGSTLGLAQ